MVMRAQGARVRMTQSRVPWLLVAVFLVVVIGKILLLYSLEWMIEAGLIRDLRYNPYAPGDLDATSDLILGLANQWDSQHFIEIARNGYPTGVLNHVLYAFAPVYPVMVASVNVMVGDLYLSGVIVSNVSHFIAMFAFYKVARLYVDYEKACLLTLVFALFPTLLVYCTVAYSEAPYLMFALWSWYYFKQERYFPCALLTSLAILTRYIAGLLLVIYGVIELVKMIDKYRTEHSFRRAFNSQLLWFVMPVVSVCALFAYFWSVTGNFMVTFDSHMFFGDKLSTPIDQFRWFFEGFFTTVNPTVEPMSLVVEHYMFTIPFLVLTLSLLRDDEFLAIYGIFFMWVTLSMEGISGIAAPRIMLSAWVAFLALRNRIDRTLALVLASLFLVLSVWVLYQFETRFFA